MAFTIVTRQKCGKFSLDHGTRNLPDTLWEKYFGTADPVTLKNLMNTFKESIFDHADINDNVKVCMLYLVEAMLLGGEKR